MRNLGAIAAFGLLRNARIVVPIIAGTFGLLQIVSWRRPGYVAEFVPLLDDSMITLGWVFMLGASAAMFSDRIPMRHVYGAGAIAVTAATLWFGGFLIIGIPAFVYGVIWIASALPKWFHRIGAKNDYSYGIYLYGWPVQQVLAYVGLQHKMIPYVLLSFAGAAVMAWLSWHGVEKWAMKLKDFTPRWERSNSPAPAVS